MRIVIDMQGVQTESRFSSIGRDTMSFTKALVRNKGEHEIILALNALFPETIEPLRAAFDDLLPQENIRVWYSPGPVREKCSGNDGRRAVAELIREAFLSSFHPDVIHISSLFEGYNDDGVTSISRFDQNTPVTVSFYNDIKFNQDISYSLFSQRKQDFLRQSARCFVFSNAENPGGKINITLNGLKCVNFSTQEDWHECTLRALTVFASVSETSTKLKTQKKDSPRPRLAFVSPFPPEKTGIAYYSAELLPELAEYYDIDVVVAQEKVNDSWIRDYANVRDVNWLRKHNTEVDRVLYHFGNSSFHQNMLSLLNEIPGVVVLHDFFIGHLLHFVETHIEANYWSNALYSCHGYKALVDRFSNPDAALFKYPTSLGVIQKAQGVIVHSKYSCNLAWSWYGKNVQRNWEIIPHLRSPEGNFDKINAKRKLNFGNDDFVICSFGFLGVTKLNHRLIDCWLQSALSSNKHCHLIFVGEKYGNDYCASLLKTISSSAIGDRIRITGFVSRELYREYLMAADVAVQLRTQSRGETSGTVLDCMNYALPLIVNANGSMAEIDPMAVWLMPDEFDDSMLIEALEALWRDSDIRLNLGERAHKIIINQHNPAECAKRYAETIERFHFQAECTTPALIRTIAASEALVFNDTELIGLAKNISATLPLPRPEKRIFLDISATCRNDLKTGIERVTRALLLAMIKSPPLGYRIEPVCLTQIGGEWHYRYANQYTLELLECPSEVLDNEIVEAECGDILLVLDLSGDILVQADCAGLFESYRNRGVRLYSIVFDILPIQMPNRFPPQADRIHERWLQAISSFNGAVCISKTVADDFASWREKTSIDMKNCRPFGIGWFQLGADIINSAPCRGIPKDGEETLHKMQSRPTLLMVGTIEPRKGYLQVIEAFSEILQEGYDINLIIVGNEGWKNLPIELRRDIPETINCLRNHTELHRRLLWLEGISDEYLEKIYAASSCLIAASYGEGFGLPLIEAAMYKLPIIARDIPVFREVGGDCSFYFHASNGSELAMAIKDWLALYKENRHPKSEGTDLFTWKQSAERLIQICIDEEFQNYFPKTP